MRRLEDPRFRGERVLGAFIAIPIRLYKFLISPLLGCRCRFYPSCSVYTREALERHGVAKGLWLGGLRLLRCHPWSECGFSDPVPESFKWGFDWSRAFRYKRGDLQEK